MVLSTVYGSIKEASESMSSRNRNAPDFIIQVRVLKVIPSCLRRRAACHRQHPKSIKKHVVGQRAAIRNHHHVTLPGLDPGILFAAVKRIAGASPAKARGVEDSQLTRGEHNPIAQQSCSMTYGCTAEGQCESTAASLLCMKTCLPASCGNAESPQRR
jgi:hypothetical protein